MVIKNNTNVEIYIDWYGNLSPGATDEIHNNIFDTINIHCGIGCAEIICEYGEVFIKCFGGIYIEKNPKTGILMVGMRTWWE